MKMDTAIEEQTNSLSWLADCWLVEAPDTKASEENPVTNKAVVSLSIRQLVDGFILSYKLEGKSPLTIDGHERKLKRFVDYLEQKEITQVTPEAIRQFLGHVRDEYKLEQATVQRYFITLKAFWRWAVDEGYASENPTTKVKLGKAPQKLAKGLTPEQVKVLFSDLKDNRRFRDVRDKAIILILMDCGLRVSELASLKIEDVDASRGVLTVMGKNSKQRLARMGLKTQKALWRYMTVRNSPLPWLWVNRNGDRLTSNGVQQMMRKLGRRIGVPLHPHLLRHTFAINFLRNGADTFVCQQALGHESLEMTRRYCQTLGFDDVFKTHKEASPVDNAMRKCS